MTERVYRQTPMKAPPARAAARPISRVSAADLEKILSALSVDFVRLAECSVSPEWRLEFHGVSAPGVHYILAGSGRVRFAGREPIDIEPDTLFITPPNQAFRIEAPLVSGEKASNRVLGSWDALPAGTVHRFVAGEGDPRLLMICGYFQASYGMSVDLFSSLDMPIVEQFDRAERIEATLGAALQELVAQEVGSGAMTATLLKLVLISLLRRSLTSLSTWVETFSMLRDTRITRAFSLMAASPGAAHSVDALARKVGMSRSAFMARFTEILGNPPMTVLRELRMRQAATMFANHELSVDHIARSVGYASRSSFLRAFHAIHGVYPAEYRAGK